MAFQPVVGVAEVDIRGTLNGQLVENTIFLRNGDGWTSTNLAEAATDIRDWWFAEMMPHIASGYAFREVFIKDLSVEAGEEASNAIGFGILGGDTSQAMPGNVSLAVSFRTGLAGRSFRGRNFVPGLTVGDVGGNTVTTDFQTVVQDAYNALLTALADSDFTWVVVSRVADHVLRESGLSTPVISAFVTDVLIDSMRRRLTGRGS
jgi:hypothetical protein